MNAQDDPRVEAFWAAFLQSRSADLPPDTTYYEAFSFGGEPDEYAALVLAGDKTATSQLWWAFKAEGKRPPEVGDYSIVLSAAGEPFCVIRTTEARVVPFDEVDAQFAYDYGEGDRTLPWWRENLWDYYARECTKHGWQPSQDMPIFWERIQVVYRGG